MPYSRTAISLAIVAVASAAALVYARAQDYSYGQVQQGKYLVDAGDCVACHTADRSKPFAGGRAIPTPFGTIYSRNITPDRQTGIGAWSEEEFYSAMHFGIRPDGTRLYPAFPYPFFTKVTREDVIAIRAYLNTLEPISNKVPANDLTWPLNYRVLMGGWDWLFFEPGVYQPNARKSAEWNRGAYLVQGLGHCGACHTPKNVFGADESDKRLQGSEIQNWWAPKLSGNQPRGLGSWSTEEIVEYLRTGRNRHSGATGLMAEVVQYSTSKLSDADLRAIAVYLKDTAGPAQEAANAPSEAQMSAGSAIFADQCAACHQADGAGVPLMFPPMKGNAAVQQSNPTTIIRVILQGARTVPTDRRPTPSSMPPFDWKLTDEEVAAVASYVRNAWNNKAPPVSADQVKSLRSELRAAQLNP